jgi:hypothetical protein
VVLRLDQTAHLVDRGPAFVPAVELGIVELPHDLPRGRDLDHVAAVALGDQRVAVGQSLAAAARAGPEARRRIGLVLPDDGLRPWLELDHAGEAALGGSVVEDENVSVVEQCGLMLLLDLTGSPAPDHLARVRAQDDDQVQVTHRQQQVALAAEAVDRSVEDLDRIGVEDVGRKQLVQRDAPAPRLEESTKDPALHGPVVDLVKAIDREPRTEGVEQLDLALRRAVGSEVRDVVDEQRHVHAL